MKNFAALFAALDATTKTGAKLAALTDYFRTAPDADRVWAIALLSGRRPKRAVSATELRAWAAEAAGVPLWLFEESYAVAGDLAETIAAMLPPADRAAAPVPATVPAPAPVPAPATVSAPDPAPESQTLDVTIRGLIALSGQPAALRKAAILTQWRGLGRSECFLFNKLITGGFRMGVSQGLMTRALAQATGMDEAALAHNLMGDWDPARTAFAALVRGTDAADARPYPFALAAPLDAGAEALGDPAAWRAEWKWDGIRAQLVHRPGAFALWSRGEELVTDRFPEFAALADFLPAGCVIDGEILAWDSAQDRPLPFADLQKRIGRKTVPKALLARAPARFVAYDLLEADGRDLRADPFDARRARLAALVAALPVAALPVATLPVATLPVATLPVATLPSRLPLALSPALPFGDWAALAGLRARARDAMAEGLMLKRGNAAYHIGRKRGEWWKWKLDPWSVDAVMVYAQAGHGRRANLYTDFTVAVRSGNGLVPFAKAYSGLTDAEFAEITRWVQKNTLDRFGPVRQVKPELVFEIAFEGIQESPRHKSGIALRFPRMVRWRRDKPVDEIDTIEGLRDLLRLARG